MWRTLVKNGFQNIQKACMSSAAIPAPNPKPEILYTGVMYYFSANNDVSIQFSRNAMT